MPRREQAERPIQRDVLAVWTTNVRKRKRRLRVEDNVQKAVIQHLQARAIRGVVYWHTPMGGYRSYAEAAIFKAMGALAGIPDLFCLHEGRLYALELKAEHGRLSMAQVNAHSALRLAGAEVAVAHGLDEALGQLEWWGLLKGNAAIVRGA